MLGREKGANLKLEVRSLLGGKGSRPQTFLTQGREGWLVLATSDREGAQSHLLLPHALLWEQTPSPWGAWKLTCPGPVIILRHPDCCDWSTDSHMIQPGQSESFPGTLLTRARTEVSLIPRVVSWRSSRPMALKKTPLLSERTKHPRQADRQMSYRVPRASGPRAEGVGAHRVAPAPPWAPQLWLVSHLSACTFFFCARAFSSRHGPKVQECLGSQEQPSTSRGQELVGK